MQQFSFKNRIAFHYIITTALLIFVVFFAIYSIVRFSVYNHVNNDINKEVQNHLNEIQINGNSYVLLHLEEWKEREHNTVDVNPVFVQFLGSNKEVIEKSPNLKNEQLNFNTKSETNSLFDTKLSSIKIRQIQVAIVSNNKIVGYLMIAMSLEYATLILQNLLEILVIAYPLILLILFFIARFIAGRSIRPINTIIETSNRITTNNLSSRITLPQKKDELFVLSQTINNLLNRIETTVEREKKFTSDASHELRTPLTVIKGTLEVLVRKPRTEEEYHEKISYCVAEVDRLNHLVDQLLLLARYENQKQSLNIDKINLNAVVLEVISRFSHELESKKIQVVLSKRTDFYYNTDRYLISIILSNLLSNAIKYSNLGGSITITFVERESVLECHITDTGIGIPEEDLQLIFDQFYRSKSSDHPEIKGTGLGLSIVNRLSEMLHLTVAIQSHEGNGTTVILSFL
ncbi:MAG: HAMP domain-containing protein [Flavobacteriaceae bacterium]|nr:HAMP domain-containing protein [Flavobacteriaceae bacterium]